MSVSIRRLAVPAIVLLCMPAGCTDPAGDLVRDNPKDPLSINWVPPMPQIQNVRILADNSVAVQWVSSTRYGTGYKIERRIHLAATYTLLATIPGNAFATEFIDRSVIPRGHTYDYRVGVIGPAGTVSYSYDYAIDIY